MMNIEEEAIKAYNKSVDFFKYGNVDCEYKRGFLNGFEEGYKIERRNFLNQFCKNCEDYKDGCQKYTIYKSFVREKDCQKIKDFLEK